MNGDIIEKPQGERRTTARSGRPAAGAKVFRLTRSRALAGDSATGHQLPGLFSPKGKTIPNLRSSTSSYVFINWKVIIKSQQLLDKRKISNVKIGVFFTPMLNLGQLLSSTASNVPLASTGEGRPETASPT